MKTTARVSVLAGIAALAVGAAAPAAAEQIERGRFHDVFVSDPYEDCGLTLQDSGDVHGSFVGTRRGSDGLAYFTENVHGTITTTNLANDLSYTQVFNEGHRDLQVTDNGDGTLTVTVLATGGARVYGPDGKIVARNPGQVRFQLLIDNGGTPGDPTDDEFLEFLGVIKGSTGRNEEFGCEQIVELIG